MRTRGAFIPLALLFAAGCTTAKPAATSAAAATFVPSSSVPLPNPTIQPTEPAAKVVMIIDDFEGAKTDLTICTDPECADSSAVGLALTSEHVAQGRQALQVKYMKNDRPKAIFFIQEPMGLSAGRYVKFDIYNPGTFDGVGFALTTGPDSIWHESNEFPVEAGKTTTLSFDLTANNYKTAATQWEFRAMVADINDVEKLSIIIYPKVTGSAFIDNIYLTNSP